MDKKAKECLWRTAAIVFGLSTLGFTIFASCSKEFTPTLYLMKMFYSEKNGFNWTAFTALAAVLALGFNWRSNQKQIKANIVSKSRIEWIQHVRHTTSKLLTSYNRLTNDRNRDGYLSTLEEIRLNSETFKLYFGSKDSSSTSNKLTLKTLRISSELLNINSNDSKNNLMVSFVNLLMDEYILEDKKYTFEEKLFLETKLSDYQKKLNVAAGYSYEGDIPDPEVTNIDNFELVNGEYENENLNSKEDIEKIVLEILQKKNSKINFDSVAYYLEDFSDEDYDDLSEDKRKKLEEDTKFISDLVSNNLELENWINIYGDALDDDDLNYLTRKYIETNEKLKTLEKFIDSLNQDLKLLGEAVRIYLKIEWDIAKKCPKSERL